MIAEGFLIAILCIFSFVGGILVGTAFFNFTKSRRPNREKLTELLKELDRRELDWCEECKSFNCYATFHPKKKLVYKDEIAKKAVEFWGEAE